MSAPVRPCVVDTGRPKNVASNTVSPAPKATEPRKTREVATASGTRPFAENVLTSPAASTSVSSDPTSCATVARASAVL